MSFIERIWEFVGFFFSGLLSGFERLVTSLFGSANARQIKRMNSRVDAINAFEPEMQALSNDGLKEKTDEFRRRLREGETLEDILVEAFAACRESGVRHLGMRHYDVQMLGGMVLHSGAIAEMVTGEGKTLVATLAVYLNGIEGKGVHVVTVNDYLARRDMEWMGPVYLGLGLTVGTIQSNMPVDERQAAYACDITYGTNNEFGFDYLRDNMRPAARHDDRFPKRMQQSQGPLNFAVIDEVDNILIDEARTPLIISGPASQNVKQYAEADQIARKLKKDEHFEVNEKDHSVGLTDAGVRQAETLAGVESFYTAGNMHWPHLLDNSLKAHYLYQRDVRYVVDEGQVIIVDEFTGRKMEGRQWSDGLHQAVEAKEGVKIKEETQTLATITLQNFFKLYNSLSGMTGTALTEAGEFWKIYQLNVVAIPTNREMQRDERPDFIFCSEKEKYVAVADEIERLNKWDVITTKKGDEHWGTVLKENDEMVDFHPRDGGAKSKKTLAKTDIDDIQYKGRPVLVGTTSIEKSELISGMLEKRGISHEVLNAKHHTREASIVAQAGRINAVTIATNMAGRGTDIILGGNPDTLAWARLQDTYSTRLDVPRQEWEDLVAEIQEAEGMKAQGEKVKQLGGLHVIGTERHESRRIDLQLRGRTGRQGDPGSSRFYLSLSDDLMRIFAGPWAEKILKSLGMPEGEAIESRMVTRRIEAAQKKVEERNFEIRKNLLEYDEVMDEQRKRIYRYRQRILDGVNCKDLILEMIGEQVDYYIDMFLDRQFGPDSFASWVSTRLSTELDARSFRGMDFESARDFAIDEADRLAETQILDAVEENLPEDEEGGEWNWESLAKFANARWELNVRDRDLKKVGRDHVTDTLLEKAREAIRKIDLAEGEGFLEETYGVKTALNWVKNKFSIEVPVNDIETLERDQLKKIVIKEAKRAYDLREAEYPVMAGLYRYSRKTSTGQSQIDREGLVHWAKQRFDVELSIDDLKNKQRDEIQSLLVDHSKKRQQEAEEMLVVVETKLDSIFTDSDPDQSARNAGSNGSLQSLSHWLDEALDCKAASDELAELDRDGLGQKLRGAVEDRFRPEIRRMERSLVLQLVDSAWKDHLLAMDHLRSAVGLVGYAQVDPKVEFKREGMKLFEQMWVSIGQRTTDLVFRMEQLDEGLVGSTWVETAAVHEEAQSTSDIAQQQQAGIDASGEKKKREPIRNLGKRVGRNDPCACGSGKKYKNCCMGK